jgi:hypothetical protein
VIHVKVGKEDGINRLDGTKPQVRRAWVAAVKEQRIDALSIVDFEKGRIVFFGAA